MSKISTYNPKWEVPSRVVASRLKMVAFRCYGRPKKCPQK